MSNGCNFRGSHSEVIKSKYRQTISACSRSRLQTPVDFSLNKKQNKNIIPLNFCWS